MKISQRKIKRKPMTLMHLQYGDVFQFVDNTGDVEYYMVLDACSPIFQGKYDGLDTQVVLALSNNTVEAYEGTSLAQAVRKLKAELIVASAED